MTFYFFSYLNLLLLYFKKILKLLQHITLTFIYQLRNPKEHKHIHIYIHINIKNANKKYKTLNIWGMNMILVWGPIEPCVQTALEEARPNI